MKGSGSVIDERPEGSNPTDNPHLSDLIEVRLSRRQLLVGAAATAAVSFVGAGPAGAAGSVARGASGHRKGGGRLRFTEVPPSDADAIVVPEGYVWKVLIPWGTALFADSPPFREDGSNSAADQARQVGFNHDGMHFFPDRRNQSGGGVLVLNHEYTDANQIYSAAQGLAITPDAAGKEKVAKALAGHGVTVVEIRRQRNGSWEHVVGARRNRGITGTTPMAFSGPVA
ncbi:MAG: DUF839 domain-containing protein, partial [Acidimicrobiia bacterium]|nr:DUF839 domain-containing protein [Acidimicrobiia bacterium]